MSKGKRSLLAAAVTVVMACGVSVSGQSTLKPGISERLDGLARWQVPYRIVPMEKPIWDESWINPILPQNAIHRFVFVPQGRGLSFYATFVEAYSDESAHAMWERSQMMIQMAGKRSKEFDADEVVAWDSHLTGRWARTVVSVSTDGARGSAPTPEEWSSIMGFIESALLGKANKIQNRRSRQK